MLWPLYLTLVRPACLQHAQEMMSRRWQENGLYSVLQGAVQDRLEQATLRGHSAIVTSVDWSRDSRFVATTSDDGTIRIWNPAGTKLLTLDDGEGTANRALFSPDGTRLAAVYGDGTARVWGISGAYEAPKADVVFVLSAPESGLLNLAWSPDGTALATSSSGGTAQIWDMTTGNLRARMVGHGGEASQNTADRCNGDESHQSRQHPGRARWRIGGRKHGIRVRRPSIPVISGPRPNALVSPQG